MRRHRKDRRERKRQRKIIMFLMIGLICLLSAGYASFSSNFMINGKGTIVENNAANRLKKQIVTTGDGLYKDSYEEGRYVYKGTNPNNYIFFNNELWRIISIEKDNTLKIIRRDSLGNMAWDSGTNRNNDNNTYCNREVTYDDEIKYWGCSVWNKREGVYDDGVYSGTVSSDATLNTYLNTEYYNTLSEDKKYIQNHEFYVGKVLYHTANVEDSYKNEKTDVWNGNIGLMNVSDFLKASINPECNSYYSSRSLSAPCSLENGNYLDELKAETWTINGNSTENEFLMVQCVKTVSYYASGIKGGISGYYSSTSYQVRPVLFLKPDIKLIGDGLEENPFKITNN